MNPEPSVFELPVLLVDDEPTVLRSASLVLRGGGIREVLTCGESRDVARMLLERLIGVVVMDLSMPHRSGQEVLAEIAVSHPDTPVIVMTASNQLETAVACMQMGAVDYLVKPVEPARLVSAVRRAVETRALRAEVVSLRETLLAGPGRGHEAFAAILTQSQSMLSIFGYLRAIAPSPHPVLVTGETGTGKELIAAAIHRLSGRAGRLVPVDVASLDDAMFADTLFGHTKGAFAGASRDRDGLVHAAIDGTLFLDEIGGLSAASQVKLLRLLHDGSYYPLGADEPRRSRSRIVAATNCDVRLAVEQGCLRRDLYHRLHAHHVHLPPLRERLGDLPLLVTHFVEQEAARLGKPAPQIPPALYQLLRTCAFPGNVQELADMCRDAMARQRGPTLSLQSFRERMASAREVVADAASATMPQHGTWLADELPTLEEAEDALVAEALRRAGGNQGVAAGLLGISRQAMNRRVGPAAKIGRAPRFQPNGPDLHSLTAVEAVALLRSGKLSAERYARALIERCRAYADVNAFTCYDEERVLDAARDADRRRKSGVAPALHGLPLVIKDNIDTVGTPTAAGTPALRSNVPKASAPVAEALFRAGAILLGKTNMHELADGITNNNAAFGAVHNPYAPMMIPGGSSGGTAAAIAARMCAAGLGTDTGGSVRIPAALCGVVGLRPTTGRYSGAGIVPISHTRDTAGPLGRTVADVALLDAVITDAHRPAEPPRLKGLRIGIPRVPFYEDLDPELAAVIARALAQLREAGCILVQADMPNLGKLSAAAGAISYYEQSRDLDAYLKAAGSSLTTRDVAAQIASPDVRAIFETDVLGAAAITVQAYREAIEEHRPRLQAAYARHFREQNIVAIALPTTALPARPIGQDREIELNGRPVPTFATFLRNTRVMTIAGIPGLSIPAGLTASGLPVGLELDAPAGADRALLGIGVAVEAILGHLPPPP